MIHPLEEIENCNPIKAILMCMVVLYHSTAMYMSGGWGPYDQCVSSPILGYFAEWLNSFHIYAFTLISGYVYFFLKFEKGKYQNYFSFLENKAKRLLIPFVFIAVVWAIPVYAYYYGTEQIAEKFVFGKAPSQLWFLLMLFWVFAIFGLISDFIYRRPIWGAAIVCVLFCIGRMMPGYWCLNTGLKYMLFFYLGFMIRKMDLGNKALYKISWLLYLTIDILLFIAVKYLNGLDGILFGVIRYACSVLLHMVGAVAAFVVLQKLVHRYQRVKAMFSLFAKYSMIVYLLHQQLIWFSIGWFHERAVPVVMVVSNFLFSITVSMAVAILMSKSKVTRVLVGSK